VFYRMQDPASTIESAWTSGLWDHSRTHLSVTKLALGW
jgi:hypothetical protein